LDAHYSGGGTAGQDYECPLLEEIEAIGGSDNDSYIFIDDARLFCSPPPRPHSVEDWPTISDVILKIHQILGDEFYITITEDIIIAVPPSAKDIVQEYAQDVATKEASNSDIQRGIALVIQGVFNEVNTETTRKILKKSGLYPIARKLYHKINTS
jgi:hypothetical protein